MFLQTMTDGAPGASTVKPGPITIAGGIISCLGDVLYAIVCAANTPTSSEDRREGLVDFSELNISWTV